ncbi:MAG: efflux RND transporter periplasmic adaptor subunit, partial [Calditrichaeota bacterium]
NQKLHKTGDISDYIFENSRLQLASADAALQQARAARDLARKRLDDATLRAPFDGRIAAKQFDLGNTAAPGVPVVTLVDIRRLKVKIGVSEQDVVRLRKNQPASLQIDAYPGHTFQGRISAIAPDADMRTRTFPVEIVLTNPAEYPLRAGMVAKVRVQLSQIKGVPMIPTSSLVQSAQTRVAFVVRNGKAEKRTLKLGPQKGNRIAVLQGLQPGEKVIVLGQDRVSDGSQVKIVQENKLLPQ